MQAQRQMSKARVIESIVCDGANRMHVTVQRDGENIMTRVGIGGHFYEVWGWPAFIQTRQWLLAMYAQREYHGVSASGHWWAII